MNEMKGIKMKGIKMKFYIKWALSLLMIFIVSCKGGAGKFEGLDATNLDPFVNPVKVSIASYYPTTNPISLTSLSQTTFGVILVETDASVVYNFLLDNTTALQSGSIPIYDLNTAGMTAGSHTLKVTASNSISSDSHTFNIVINSPPTFSSFTPTLTGTNLSCGITSQDFSVIYSDANISDTVTQTWSLNDSEVILGNATATVTNDPAHKLTLLNFHPNCEQTGINFVKLVLNDGLETTSQTWTINVIAPITIHISDSIPTTDPTVLTAATSATFGVTLQTADPTATFNFILDNTIPVQNDRRSYMALLGSGLGPGNHTLRVIASNANSTDTHTFNIRKNVPPIATAYSPALSGTSVSCGSAPINLYADMFDSNADTLSYTWTVDEGTSTYITPGNSGNRAQATFNPSCAISGNRVIKVAVSDGYETTTVTWAISIITPVTIHISTFSPSVSPVILTNAGTTTFTVSLSPSDIGVNYKFDLKNLATAASSTLQDGPTPFYDMVGSTLSIGTYELKVTASNGTSSDFHVFTLRKNSPPLVPPSPLTFSPALTGATINCNSASQIVQSYISDPDNDTMTFAWFLDGSSSTSNLINSSTQSLAKATYTPSCSDIGAKTIRLEVNDGREITAKTWTVTVYDPAIVIQIASFTPATDPVYLTSTASTTLGVTLTTADASASYSFLLDNTVILQSGLNAFYTINSGSLSAGNHTIKVTASNTTSSANHTFNITVNSPPSVVSFIPTLTGTSLACGLNNATLSMIYADANLTDTISAKWYLNNVLVGFGNTTVIATNDPSNNIASVNFHPDCTQTGINLIRIDLFDGHEITSQTWTVYVTAPIIMHISDIIPTTDPTVLTSSTSSTFGVTLQYADATANFNFVLDNSVSVQNDHRTFYNLSGASLTTGTHTLKVTASNSNSSDTKTFNIRKNAPAIATAYSPALTGTSVTCGAAPFTIYADMTDPNSDTLSYTWYLDDAPSGNITPGNSGNRAQATFNPSCAITGNRMVKVVVSDGYETTSVSWAISVITPVTMNIASFSPTTTPIIITNSSKTTFTVALTINDINVSYAFKLKNLASGVETVLQTSADPFYDLVGSNVAAGTYQLTATATNSSSNDSHVFTVRKNTAPAAPPSGQAFSPALSGLTMACGASTQIFQSVISDADSDTMTISWSIDGSTTASNLVAASTQALAKATFTPTCSDVGVRTIKADISDGYETTSKIWVVTVYNPAIIIAINSVTPTTEPTNLTSNVSATFGVTLLNPDASANYTFLLDNTTVLQTGTNPFYNLLTSTLTAGSHIIRVTASNVTSSASHLFTITVNAPPVFVSFTPTLTVMGLNCGLESATLSALYADANLSDAVSVNWYLNNTLVSFGNASATASNDSANKIASLNYHPGCTQTGINLIRIDLNDGHEISTQTWAVYVTAPIIIHISDSTPTTDPTVLTGTNSATFGVTLLIPDSTANYTFVLDNATTVQNDHRTFYSLAGSTLSSGPHTLKVTATNATSTDTKTFNIRKNSAPTVSAFTPAFSGTTVNCGAAAMTLQADMFDANGDSLTYSWYVDDAPSAYITTSNSGNRAQASFNPSCNIAGTRVVKAVVSDSYETTTVTWSISIATPITVHITNFLPSTNPTILTASQTTTFAVALSTSDANVSYNFVLRNLATNVSTTLQSGSVPFYNLVASGLTGGLYELTATATNGTSSDSHVFSIRKNSPPALPPDGYTYSPSLTGIILNCGASSQVLQSAISDANSDIMSITWSLNGQTTSSTLVSNSTQTQARATYTPDCTQVGVQSVKVDVYDGYETTSLTWTVTVVNPTIVTINSYSPTSDPVSILSIGSQIFSVTATGKAPLAYEWKLDGSLLAAQTAQFITLTASSLSTGAHTLVVKVSDSDTNQSKTFNIIKNAPPVISDVLYTITLPNKTDPNKTQFSSQSLKAKVNINNPIDFTGSFTDANSDAMTVTWFVNGVAVSAGNANASVATSVATSKSTLNFTPSPTLLGDNTLDLQVSDGKEMVSQSWTLNINYFSHTCNIMGLGKACTIGQPGRGSNIVVAKDPTKVMIRPVFIEPYLDFTGVATSSYFFSDDASNTVWFYNKSDAPITIGGQAIGSGVLKAILGIGIATGAAGTTGNLWNDFALDAPRGVAWDHLNQRLFVSDESNNRVVMLSSTGNVTTILNSSIGNIPAGNQNNTNALTGSWCQTPRGLQYNSTNKLLYVACYNSYTVRSIDTTNANSALWTSSIVSGSQSNGTNYYATDDGTNGYQGSNRFYYPSTLKLDKANNVLYVSDIAHCKIKAINMSGSSKSYFGGLYTILAGRTGTIFGMTGTGPTYGTNASACTNFTTGGSMSTGVIVSAPPANKYASARVSGGVPLLPIPVSLGAFMSMELNMSGSTLLGFFVSDYSQNRIGYVNNTVSPVTIGNSTVPSYSMNVVWGGDGNIPGGGSPGYNGCSTAAAGNGCYLYNPGPMMLYNNTLYVSDYNNKRIRTLNIGTINGAVTDELGYNTKAGYAGNGGTSSENIQFNMPINLYFDAHEGRLIISDYKNYRIRSLNLNTGKIENIIGNGPGNANLAQVDPSAALLYGPRSVVNHNNHILYSDNTNSNCLVRAWNTMTSTQTILGISTYANAIQTIAGNYLNGCGPYNSLATTGNDINARLNQPQGITSDGTNIYIANTSSHCIIKVDQNGTMSVFSGACGTAGTANASGLTFNDATIRYNVPTAVVVDPRAPFTTAGNLFILDQTTSGISKIRYINQYSSAVDIFGVTIAAGKIQTIFTAFDNHGADLAAFDKQICFSSGGNWNYTPISSSTPTSSYHNVICFDRDEPSGTIYTRFGRNPGIFNAHGYVQENDEEEGIAGTSISLAGPAGLAFDSNGNLYIGERDGHDIRMIKKWW